MMKMQGLGSMASAVAGILITAATNATPIVATITTGHGLKNNDRIVITGITGNTGANGEWSLDAVGATTGTLRGSVGNGAFGGTAVVAVICDTTPFFKGHDAVAAVNLIGVGVATAPVLTVLVESSDDNVTFADATTSGLAAIGAKTTMEDVKQAVILKKYMRFRCSAYTSGSARAALLAGS